MFEWTANLQHSDERKITNRDIFLLK